MTQQSDNYQTIIKDLLRNVPFRSCLLAQVASTQPCVFVAEMPAIKVTKKSKASSFARLSPLAKGRIIGMRERGAERADIAKKVKKTDGTSPSVQTVDSVLQRFKQEPEWDGREERTAGGRPPHLTPKQIASIRKILLRDVGKHVVSATYVKRILRELRRVPDRTIQRCFGQLGYSYLRRRGKQAISDKYKPARSHYCDWLLKQDQASLNKFGYVDGTTFVRPRTEEEQRDNERASLGPRGWRFSDGSDSLEDHNVGDSSCAKGRGKPIKIWGLLFNGRLEYWALPGEANDNGNTKSVNMTGARYNYFVKTFLAKWRRNCYPTFPKNDKVPLVKDWERFLRWDGSKTFDNLKAERDAGFCTVRQHPKLSPDFNAIEGWWRVLQQRLFLTAPMTLEPRGDFLKRLRRTVSWLNHNARDHAKQLCTNQKARARAVKELKGARSAVLLHADDLSNDHIISPLKQASRPLHKLESLVKIHCSGPSVAFTVSSQWTSQWPSQWPPFVSGL